MSTCPWFVIDPVPAFQSSVAAPIFHELRKLWELANSYFRCRFWHQTKSAMKPHSDSKQQLLGVDRFGEIIGGAGFKAFLPVALHRLGRQRDNGEPPEGRIRTDNANGLVP